MLKIHQLFLRSFIYIFFTTLILISLSIYIWTKSLYLEQIEQKILSNIDTLSISTNNLKNIDEKLKKIKKATNFRITIINKNGNVIAETHKDKDKMDNHNNREEIIKAGINSYGKVQRYSNTLNMDLLYIAKEVTIDGEDYYIRIASEVKKIEEKFFSITFQLIGIFSLFLLLAFIISYYISNKIRQETDNILSFLVSLTKKKELDNRSDFSIEEFNTINRLLNKVALKLRKKEKIKLKHTAKLKLANKQKDEIISAISHEFKNPIAIITGYTQTLKSDSDLPKQMVEKFLNKIDSNANKMSGIIDKLRLVLKFEEEKEKLDIIEFHIKSACEDIISDLNDKYPHRNIIVLGNGTKIKADFTLLSMAISNLIENALKYSENDVEIDIGKDYIKVIDYGIGIEENDLEKITDKFYRVSQNGWNNSLGLGLYIVSAILKMHKFELEISSIYHEGSQFTIKF